MNNDFKPLITIEYTEYQRLILNQVNVMEGFVIDASMITDLINMARTRTRHAGFGALNENDFITEVINQLKRSNPKFAQAFKDVR